MYAFFLINLFVSEAPLRRTPPSRSLTPSRVSCSSVFQVSLRGGCLGSTEKDASSEKLDAFKGEGSHAALSLFTMCFQGSAWKFALSKSPTRSALGGGCVAAAKAGACQSGSPHHLVSCALLAWSACRVHGGSQGRVPQPLHHRVCHRHHPDSHGRRREHPAGQGAEEGAGGKGCGYAGRSMGAEQHGKLLRCYRPLAA